MPLSLLDLPLELTNLIFSYALPSNVIHIISTDDPYTDNEPYTAMKWFTGVTTLRPITALRHRELITPWNLGPSHHGNCHRNVSLLLVCKRIHDLVARILYSQNTFEFCCSWPDTVHGVDFAGDMLRRLRCSERNWIRTLSVDSIILNRLNFGLGHPGDFLREGWLESYENLGNASKAFIRRLRPALERFCEVVKTMSGLRELGLGVLILEGIQDWGEWDRQLDGVPGVAPLLNLFGPGGIRAKVLVWRVNKWDEWSMDKARTDGDRFVRMLAEDLWERRVLLDGEGAAELVVYVEPSETSVNIKRTRPDPVFG